MLARLSFAVLCLSLFCSLCFGGTTTVEDIAGDWSTGCQALDLASVDPSLALIQASVEATYTIATDGVFTSTASVYASLSGTEAPPCTSDVLLTTNSLTGELTISSDSAGNVTGAFAVDLAWDERTFIIGPDVGGALSVVSIFLDGSTTLGLDGFNDRERELANGTLVDCFDPPFVGNTTNDITELLCPGVGFIPLSNCSGGFKDIMRFTAGASPDSDVLEIGDIITTFLSDNDTNYCVDRVPTLLEQPLERVQAEVSSDQGDGDAASVLSGLFWW